MARGGSSLNVLDWISLTLSGLFLAGGITTDALAWAGIIGKDEPPLVLHLSTAAIIGTGISGIIAVLAAVRAKGE